MPSWTPEQLADYKRRRATRLCDTNPAIAPSERHQAAGRAGGKVAATESPKRVFPPEGTPTLAELAGITGKEPVRKYRNVPTVVDGIRFDSKREAAFYGDLKLRQMAGEITGLCADKSKLRYDLIVNGVKIATYVADYSWYERDGSHVIGDAKGVRTQVYQMKANMMKALYGIEIKEL